MTTENQLLRPKLENIISGHNINQDDADWLRAALTHPAQPAEGGEAVRWHELKTDPDVFDAVMAGRKTHEIRFNDRGFQVGDGLLLRRTQYSGSEMKAGAPLVYTGQECRRVVSHVLSGYGLADGWVILSFAAPPASQEQAQQPGVCERA